MKVRNINGTTSNKCNCKSWIEHWEKFSGKSAFICSEISCMRMTDLQGAHIQKSLVYDSNWYIIPLCPEHNQMKRELEINTNTILVSANISQTCGKP